MEKGHDNLEGFCIQMVLHVQISGKLKLEFIDNTVWMWLMQEGQLGTPTSRFTFKKPKQQQQQTQKALVFYEKVTERIYIYVF